MGMHEFAARRIAPGTWMITGAGCDCYLVEGRHEALMIDAGQPHSDIRAFAQRFTPKPLTTVINTHSHFDHTGGNGWFTTVLMAEKAAASARTVMDDDASHYRLDYPITAVQDGQTIDLGGRVLRVMILDCHSPGSLAVVDQQQNLLFCGDEIDSGQVLLLPGYAERKGQVHACPAGAVETCLRSMQRMAGVQPQIAALCPGHNGSPIDPVYREWLMRLCEGILSGKITGNADCTSRSYAVEDTHYPYANAGYLRAKYQGASLVYNRFLLTEADRDKADRLPAATPLHVQCAKGAWRSWSSDGPNKP